ncbi:hypothetical protein [Peribacillus asahii]|uniref:hypothetical protein n=1 Tax=Peribacillus asahii TaxID=228899 RepID=UPI0037F37DA5
MAWAKCEKCGRSFTHDEWQKESESFSDGWVWEEKHSDKFCRKTLVKSMDKAIVQIKQLIKHHENERDTYIEFFETSNSRNLPEDKSFLIEQTKSNYKALIDELNEAVRVLEDYRP